MSLISDIKTALAGMTVDAFADAQALDYRDMTSAPNAMPRTWGAWATLAGARTIESGEEELRDPDTGEWIRERTVQLRIPMSLGIKLTVRSQVRVGGATGLIYNVRRVLPGAAGSVDPYILAHREPMLQDPRNGGV